jgi:drug/metabolite transporter (DMT)-like permease
LRNAIRARHCYDDRAHLRKDSFRILEDSYGPLSIGKVVLLALLGLAGVLAYEISLSDANPTLIAAVLNLDPFWAALVSRMFVGKGLPNFEADIYQLLRGIP